MSSEVSHRAKFSDIRYAQCWEDADILLKALDIQPGETCLSIAAAGDNTLALLSQNPGRVIALDLSLAQLACLELRVAAYRELNHSELLILIGASPGADRQSLYQRCRSQLSAAARDFWDHRGQQIDRGIGRAGKFERYFALFRTRILPLIHDRRLVKQLLEGGTISQRQAFYNQAWNTWRWRLLFQMFFSRAVMGWAGRDPSFFKYVQGSVADRLLARTELALTQLDPTENPYLQWILMGQYTTALPYALRPENFESIRANLDRLEWHHTSIEDYLVQAGENAIDHYNLSDIFEYLSPENYRILLQQLIQSGRKGGRLAYWNMLVPRSRPPDLAQHLQPLSELARSLYAQDKAFFYSAFVIEEML
jgi:S-adenosylmethionine-diacylglycerol 3-amino-3-carboxypropyl transferase